MKKTSLNITATVLIVVGIIVISGANVWVLMLGSLPKKYLIKYTAVNGIGILSSVIGNIFSQISIWAKDNVIYTLKNYARNVRASLGIMSSSRSAGSARLEEVSVVIDNTSEKKEAIIKSIKKDEKKTSGDRMDLKV